MRCPLRAASCAGHGARVTGRLVEIANHLLGTSGPERIWAEIAAVEDGGHTAAVVRVDGNPAALLAIATAPAARPLPLAGRQLSTRLATRGTQPASQEPDYPGRPARRKTFGCRAPPGISYRGNAA